jgi:hypothetical protein
MTNGLPLQRYDDPSLPSFILTPPGLPQKNECLIDDYDQIHRDFEPFYQLAQENSKHFQAMVDKGQAMVGLNRSLTTMIYPEVRFCCLRSYKKPRDCPQKSKKQLD